MKKLIMAVAILLSSGHVNAEKIKPLHNYNFNDCPTFHLSIGDRLTISFKKSLISNTSIKFRYSGKVHNSYVWSFAEYSSVTYNLYSDLNEFTIINNEGNRLHAKVSGYPIINMKICKEE